MTYHKPVLLNESIKGLEIKPNGIYVDVTFGGGGHSKEILKNLKGGFLYAFDQDGDAINNVINASNFKLSTRYELLNPKSFFIFNRILSMSLIIE